jgi:hypothetical protein
MAHRECRFDPKPAPAPDSQHHILHLNKGFDMNLSIFIVPAGRSSNSDPFKSCGSRLRSAEKLNGGMWTGINLSRFLRDKTRNPMMIGINNRDISGYSDGGRNHDIGREGVPLHFVALKQNPEGRPRNFGRDLEVETGNGRCSKSTSLTDY